MGNNNHQYTWIILTIILLIVSIVQMMFLLNSEQLIINQIAQSILEGVGINFISALLALFVFFIVFKEFNPIKRETTSDSSIDIYAQYRVINWSEFIPCSKEIEINVIYFDHHFDKYYEDYKTFFQKGGKLKLILPNVKSKGLITEYMKMFNEYDVDRISFKIIETRKKIEMIYENYHANGGSCDIIEIDHKISYFYYNCDNKKIFLSVFENIKDGIVKSPCILINNSKLSPSFDEQYWRKEFNYYWDQVSI